MTDRIRATVGTQPWRPDAGTELVKVIQRATIPLIGIVAQDEVKYVFWCALGQAEEANLWLYAHVTDPEADELESASTADELKEVLRRVTDGRADVFALAANGDEARGIVLTGIVDPPVGFDGSLQPVADAMNREVEAINATAGAVSFESNRELTGV